MAAIDAGTDALGLNFWPEGPRFLAPADAPRVIRAARERAPQVELVGVFVDVPVGEVRALRARLGLDAVQLHGRETPADVEALQPGAYKAIGIEGPEDIARAAAYPGPRILLDARVPGGPPGGTGARFDWALAGRLAQERVLLLAGGLTPANVAEAVRRVRPHMVDVASGVETAPGVKDAEAMRAFVRAAKAAP